MFEKLGEDIFNINLEVKKIQQAFEFVLQDYDYHHDNKEEEIVAKKKAILDEVEECCTELKTKSAKLAQLLQSAREQTTFFDREIPKIAAKHNIDISGLYPDCKKAEENGCGNKENK